MAPSNQTLSPAELAALQALTGEHEIGRIVSYCRRLASDRLHELARRAALCPVRSTARH